MFLREISKPQGFRLETARDFFGHFSGECSGRARRLPGPTNQGISGNPSPPVWLGSLMCGAARRAQVSLPRFAVTRGGVRKGQVVVASVPSHPVREVLCRDRCTRVCRWWRLPRTAPGAAGAAVAPPASRRRTTSVRAASVTLRVIRRRCCSLTARRSAPAIPTTASCARATRGAAARGRRPGRRSRSPTSSARPGRAGPRPSRSWRVGSVRSAR